MLSRLLRAGDEDGDAPDRRRAARPAGHPAAGRPRDHRDRAGLGALRARPRPGAAGAGPATRPRAGDDAYLEAVLKESMRLHPVIPMVVRHLMEPATIGGIDLPARRHRRAVDPPRPRAARTTTRDPDAVPPGAVPRRRGRHQHLDPVRRRRPPLHRRRVLADGGRGGAARGAARRTTSTLPVGRPTSPQVRNITSVPRHGARVVVH